MKRAGALFRLLTPLPPEPRPGGDVGTQRSSQEFFAEVPDQTGDGYLEWPDLAAMARELSSRLGPDEHEETRLYNT